MSSVLRCLPLLLTSLVLSSCASLAPVEEEPVSAYGAFLAARYAGANRDAEGAASYYAEALDRAPGNAVLADRTFITTLLAGDLDAASGFAEAARAAGDPSRLASIYGASDQIAQRRYAGAIDTLVSAPSFGPFNAFFADLLLHWSLMGDDRPDEALIAARRLAAPGYLEPFVALHRAMLAEAAGDMEAADEDYRAAIYASPFQRMVTTLYGGFLEREQRPLEAAVLYRAYLQSQPLDESVNAALARAESGGRPPAALRINEGAGLSLFGPAASLAAQADMDLTVLYLRMVQRLYPDYAPNRMLLGETLQRIRLPEVALDEYAAVPRGPYWLGAQIDLIWLTARLDRIEAATLMAQSLIAETGEDEARLMLADLYRVQARCGEAAELYGSVIENQASTGQAGDWRYHYFRASCLYIEDRLEEAEIEYLAALELGPDEPQILNDLGYLWIEQGIRFDEAFIMVERAAALEPEEGHIIDSLGWAYYQAGDYERAVTELERAAELAPGNTTANFHLGDAYWQVGRRLEARFQWERALGLDPDEAERIALEDRLANGLQAEEDAGLAEHASGSALP